MLSPTHGEVSMQTIASIIAQKTVQAEPGEFELVIGTDSQNFDKTKIVVVISLYHVGHGGIFFYDIQHVHRINNVGQKLLFETRLSLECVTALVAEFEALKQSGAYDYEKHLTLAIHVNAGENGPSRQVIPQVVSWIASCGYQAVVKRDSFAACSIANKLSK